MNILLLGNGFDLQHNLPTKYENFLHTMQVFHTNFTNGLPLTLGSVFEKVANDDVISNSYNKYKTVYDELTISQDDYKKIQDLKNNCWYQYFSKIHEYSIDTWIDFEKEISNVANGFKRFFDKMEYGKTLDFDELSEKLYFKIPTPYVVARFNFFYKDNVLNDEYVSMIKDDVYAFNVQFGKIMEDLYKPLEDFSEVLSLYLDLFVNRVIVSARDEGLIECNNELFEGFDKVISFNYTNTYHKLYSYDNVDLVNYIHGNIEKDNLVLGINPDVHDELEKLDLLCIEFKKYYQRVCKGTDVGFLDDIEMIESFDKDSSLYVCGHSLDKTDEDIIKTLFSVSSKIKIICHKKSVIGDYTKNLVQIYGKKGFDKLRREKSLRFLDYSEWKQSYIEEQYIEMML